MALISIGSMATLRVKKKVAAALGVALLMVTTGLVGTAAAATAIGCGTVITETTKLTANIGPCSGEGVVIAADNITVDLNGYRITGNPQTRGSGPDQAGVVLRQVHGVTLVNGTVQGFDAGVLIAGGGRNTVTRVRAVNNVNYRVVTGRNSQPPDDPSGAPSCDLGDGIAVIGSNENRLFANTVARNGPFSGIALIEQSNRNTVAGNEVADNDLLNRPPGGGQTVCGGQVGELGPLGRLVQDVGVRIEGPGAQYNVVADNHIVRSALAGVMITAFRNAFPQANNGFNQVIRNSIFQTGLRTRKVQNFYDEYHSSGILLHNAGTTAVSLSYGNTVADNNSSNNFGGGIEILGPFPGSGEVGVGGNTIVRNVVNNNVLTGLLVNEGVTDHVLTANKGHGNGLDKALIAQLNAQDPYLVWVAADAADNNYHCDANVWSRNEFGTVNQPCVKANGGTGTVVGPVPPAPASAARDFFDIELTGEAEAPNPGDPDGTGNAKIALFPEEGRFCYVIEVEGIAPATAAHIHEAPVGEAGPVVIPLEAPTKGRSRECSPIDPALAQEILDNPSDYYVNVHNAEYPSGALRGQLTA